MLVLVEDAAKALVSSYVQVGDLVRIGDRRGQWTERAGVCDALVGTVLVVEVFELAQGMKQVALVPDQRPVQQLASAGLHPPLHDRVHSWHSDAAEHYLDPRVPQHGVEQLREFAASVPDHEPRRAARVLEIHDEVLRRLHHPGCGRCAVAPRIRIRRLPCLMIASTHI
jgi:hypothetical protein